MNVGGFYVHIIRVEAAGLPVERFSEPICGPANHRDKEEGRQ